MNGSTLIYNTSSNSQHSFQIGGTQNTYINSNGLTCNNTITCNNLTSNNNITCFSLNVGNGNVNIYSFLYVGYGLGIGTNTPLFPLDIRVYQSSYQTYKFLNYNGVGDQVVIQIIILSTAHMLFVLVNSMLYQMNELKLI